MSVEEEWDVATLIRDLLRSEFGSHTGITGIPDDRIVLRNTEAGKALDYTREYIVISEQGDRGFQFRWLDMSGYDAAALAQAELATPESRDRREELWGELLEVAIANRKRSAGTPGNWDTLTVDGAPVNDDAHNWWAMECIFAFDSQAKSTR